LVDSLGQLAGEVESAFSALPDAAHRAAVDDPLVHFTWLRVMESARDGRAEELSARLRDVGRLFLVPCIREGAASEVRFPVQVREGELRFVGHEVHLQLPREMSGFGFARVIGDDLVLDGDAWDAAIPVDALLNPGRV
jgi:hypothetical protein